MQRLQKSVWFIEAPTPLPVRRDPLFILCCSSSAVHLIVADSRCADHLLLMVVAGGGVMSVVIVVNRSVATAKPRICRFRFMVLWSQPVCVIRVPPCFQALPLPLHLHHPLPQPLAPYHLQTATTQKLPLRPQQPAVAAAHPPLVYPLPLRAQQHRLQRTTNHHSRNRRHPLPPPQQLQNLLRRRDASNSANAAFRWFVHACREVW